MSTKALVSIKRENGTYAAIEIANDGYVQNGGVGYMLYSYYSYPIFINPLIEAGSVSSLGSIKNTTQIKEVVPPVVCSSIEELLKVCKEKSIEYLYVLHNNEWKFTNTKLETAFMPLSLDITMEKPGVGLIDIPKYCSYDTAAHWGGANLVLLNNIVDIDTDFNPYEGLYEEYDTDGTEEEQDLPEFFQFYITNLSDDSVEWNRETFPDLVYQYSDLVDAWILCVPHYGTSWDYVQIQYVGDLRLDLKEWQRFNK